MRPDTRTCEHTSESTHFIISESHSEPVLRSLSLSSFKVYVSYVHMCPHTTYASSYYVESFLCALILLSLSLCCPLFLCQGSFTCFLYQEGRAAVQREGEEEEGREAKREEKERGREEVRGVIYRE